MKKTLLSILTGLMVIGLAVAAPTPDDRRALCEKHPEKYVWVEKDQFCAPINPCESDNAEIKEAYCLAFPMLPKFWVKSLSIVDIYVKNVLHTKLSDMALQFIQPGVGFVPLSEVQHEDKTGYIGFKTVDGGYFVMPWGEQVLDGNDAMVSRSRSAVMYAFAAYGYLNTIDGITSISADVPNEQGCIDIQNLSDLLGGWAKYRYESGKCIMDWTRIENGLTEFY